MALRTPSGACQKRSVPFRAVESTWAKNRHYYRKVFVLSFQIVHAIRVVDFWDWFPFLGQKRGMTSNAQLLNIGVCMFHILILPNYCCFHWFCCLTTRKTWHLPCHKTTHAQFAVPQHRWFGDRKVIGPINLFQLLYPKAPLGDLAEHVDGVVI